MTLKLNPDPYLSGQLIIAMPGMADPRFAKSVIYVCAHGPEGAMGLVVNRVHTGLTFGDMLSQLSLPSTPETEAIRVHFGGPVDAGRGFVLHTPDYMQDSTMVVDDDMALTATVDILRDMADGGGPRHSLLALGYAGWAPGQLDDEIKDNGWLTVPADEDLVFGDDLGAKWSRALAKIGIDPALLSEDAGHA